MYARNCGSRLEPFAEPAEPFSDAQQKGGDDLDETNLIWADDDDTDPRDTMPEMRQYLAYDRRGEEEASFRTLIEHPEACARAWWRPSRGRPLFAA